MPNGYQKVKKQLKNEFYFSLKREEKRAKRVKYDQDLAEIRKYKSESQSIFGPEILKYMFCMARV